MSKTEPKFNVGDEVEVMLGHEPYPVSEIQEVIYDLGDYIYRVKMNNVLSDFFYDYDLRLVGVDHK